MSQHSFLNIFVTSMVVSASVLTSACRLNEETQIYETEAVFEETEVAPVYLTEQYTETYEVKPEQPKPVFKDAQDGVDLSVSKPSTPKATSVKEKKQEKKVENLLETKENISVSAPVSESAKKVGSTPQKTVIESDKTESDKKVTTNVSEEPVSEIQQVQVTKQVFETPGDKISAKEIEIKTTEQVKQVQDVTEKNVTATISTQKEVVKPKKLSALEKKVLYGQEVHDWSATSGETLRSLLMQWGEQAGWTVAWKLDRDYHLEAGVIFRGTFTEVAAALIRSFARATPAPIGTFYKGNRVLVINTQEDENAN